MPHRRIAINISAVQFKQKDLLDTIKYALETSGLSPEFLEVEVTETVVMQNASQAIVTLEKLSEMGIHVAIDDFGPATPVWATSSDSNRQAQDRSLVHPRDFIGQGRCRYRTRDYCADA
jgi:predicted signal transduction protein with EAL and GGDEF domain